MQQVQAPPPNSKRPRQLARFGHVASSTEMSAAAEIKQLSHALPTPFYGPGVQPRPARAAMDMCDTLGHRGLLKKVPSRIDIHRAGQDRQAQAWATRWDDSHQPSCLVDFEGGRDAIVQHNNSIMIIEKYT